MKMTSHSASLSGSIKSITTCCLSLCVCVLSGMGQQSMKEPHMSSSAMGSLAPNFPASHEASQ